MPLNFLVDQIAGALTDALGLRNKETSPTSWELVQESDKQVTETVKDVGTTVYKTVEDVVRNGWDFLTKYWYIPVIVGGVIVGYLLISRNNPAQLISTIAALNAAQN